MILLNCTFFSMKIETYKKHLTFLSNIIEKLSSQIMVKKTRSEKPGSKLDDIVLPTPSSRPHTPNNFSKHDSYKSNPNKKVTSEHKPGTMFIF